MRASQLDRVLACPASQIAPSVRIEGDSAPAKLGTALHKIMQAIVTGEPEPDVSQLAREADADPDELGMLRILGKRFWDKYRASFPDPVCEVHLSDYTQGGVLTGHPDVMCVVDGEVRGLDWKSGFLESPWENQVRAYCYLAMLHTGATRAWWGVAHLRSQELIPVTYTRPELTDWYADARDRVERTDIYNPSPETCQYCPRRLECPARVTVLRDALSVIVDIDQSEAGYDLAALTDAELRHGVTSAKAIAKICEDYLRHAKTEVQVRGNDVAGMSVKQEKRREIVPQAAWEILEHRVGLPVLVDCVKIGKTKVEDAIRATAPRGQKQAQVQSLMEELNAVGALAEKVIEKLEVKPVPTALPNTKEIEVQA